MIKKFVSVISIIILSVSSLLNFSSCDWLKSDYEIIDDKVMEIIHKLENSDKEGIKKLFAKSKIKDIDNFDESVDELLDYYDGKYISKFRHSPGKFRDKEGKFSMTYFLPSFDVTTTVDTYRIAFYFCTEYTTDKNSVGIWSLYIIKAENDNDPLEVTYRGDGLWTPGINIGKT